MFIIIKFNSYIGNIFSRTLNSRLEAPNLDKLYYPNNSFLDKKTAFLSSSKIKGRK